MLKLPPGLVCSRQFLIKLAIASTLHSISSSKLKSSPFKFKEMSFNSITILKSSNDFLIKSDILISLISNLAVLASIFEILRSDSISQSILLRDDFNSLTCSCRFSSIKSSDDNISVTIFIEVRGVLS